MEEYRLSKEQSDEYRRLFKEQDKATAALALAQSRINVFFAETCLGFEIDPNSFAPDRDGEVVVLKRLKRPQG